MFYALVAGGALLLLLIFKPIRELFLKLVGAQSLWGLAWSIVAVVFTAHLTVFKNFLPRSFVFPTLDDRRTTNAED